MYLFLLTFIAIIALNFWYRRWLRSLSDEKRQQAVQEMRDEAQRWQL